MTGFSEGGALNLLLQQSKWVLWLMAVGWTCPQPKPSHCRRAARVTLVTSRIYFDACTVVSESLLTYEVNSVSLQRREKEGEMSGEGSTWAQPTKCIWVLSFGYNSGWNIRITHCKNQAKDGSQKSTSGLEPASLFRVNVTVVLCCIKEQSKAVACWMEQYKTLQEGICGCALLVHIA